MVREKADWHKDCFTQLLSPLIKVISQMYNSEAHPKLSPCFMKTGDL